MLGLSDATAYVMLVTLHLGQPEHVSKACHLIFLLIDYVFSASSVVAAATQ